MAVYTHVSFDEAKSFLHALNLGTLQKLEGCVGGIENTNYFVTTDQAPYVLTLFERLSAEQLPFYLRLMKHLANHGIPVPNPAADHHGNVLHQLCGKPAAVVNLLAGKCELAPDAGHCSQVGAMLARMHLAGQDFSMQQPHLRGLSWWNSTAPSVMAFLSPAQSVLLQSELAYQNHVASQSSYAALPQGPIHADLFRDNVMFKSEASGPVLSGFFDFYFAGVDTWLFDLAVCLNDWCVDWATVTLNPARFNAMFNAYQSVRPLQAPERNLLPALLRAAALRFWLSRLWDWHLPRDAAVLKPHDPSPFEQLLRLHIQTPLTMNAIEHMQTTATTAQ